MKSKSKVSPFDSFGPISSGTLRPEDLLDAFLYEARNRFPASKYVKIISASMAALDNVRRVIASGNESAAETAWMAWYSSEIVNRWINEDLFDLLGSDLPDFVSFSTHEGDGACFGYWFDHESFEYECNDGGCIKGSQLPDSATKFRREFPGAGYFAVVSDHGNITLYCMDEYRKGYFKFRELYSVV